MTRLEIRWPDDSAERVRAARGRLIVAGEALRRMTLDERLALVERVLAAWCAEASPYRSELATRLAETTALHADTVREGLDAAFAAWRPERFVECARREAGAEDASGSTRLAPFDWTAIVAGGGVPMPTLLNAFIALALGSPVLLRETSGDRATAPLLRRSLEAEDERLARAFEAIAFSAEDAAFDELLGAPCVVATGSDETIRSISARLRPSQRFVSFGHRFSIGVLGSRCEAEAGGLSAVADGFALDVARWDQLGCLSPVVVYLVGLDGTTAAETARAFARSLEAVSRRLPRGELTTAIAAAHANERAEARMRQASGDALSIEGTDFTLVLEADARPRRAPLHRFLRLMPVDSLTALERTLRPLAAHLSNAALAGFDRDEEDALQRRLVELGVSRCTRPGRLQTPPIDWPHDGMPLFGPFARFGQID